MSTRLPERHDRGPRRGALPLNLVPILVRPRYVTLRDEAPIRWPSAAGPG